MSDKRKTEVRFWALPFDGNLSDRTGILTQTSKFTSDFRQASVS